MSFKEKPSSRQALGRGLDSLFSSTPTSKGSTVLSLSIEQIIPNPRQPRRIFDKDFLSELANSIKKNGLIQPIIVKKRDEKYEIVAGERRWRAAAQAGLYEVPVRVLEPEKDSPFLSLVENLQRQDLNPLELARAYKTLLQTYKLTQEKLADQLGVPRASLANQLRILNLSEEVQVLIMRGQLSFALAKILLQVQDPTSQTKWARFFVKNKVGVREAQSLLSKAAKINKKKRVSKPIGGEDWQGQAMNKIQDIYGVKSSLRWKKKGGELCLRFFSDEQLRNLIDILVRPS